MPAAIYFFGYFHRIPPAVVAGDLMRAFSISAASLGNLSAIYPYVFAFMGLPAGSFADTLGPRWTLALGSGTIGIGAVPFTAVYAACWALLALPGEMRLPLGALAAVLLLMGFASSGLVLVFVCVREVNDPARVGITIGFCNLPVFLVFALVQWLTGLILNARWEGLIAGGARIYPASAWEAAFVFCLAMALASLVLTFFVAETRCRNIWGHATSGVRPE